ncbi:Na+/H+ antiporter subunit E [Ornithinimicrobium faecis]|uniref:Na+/H+ antiporter subunit E n=1 Tax=Ornithinimicrobium faecis TaxID=2934158 RepID=A0ABY4YTD1_9MICO|nr:Na+/H+ antiporter subunit E [Ornithinimicrobium sp. HY1793]USQ80038.1 Na+/H+ antiporter subunit E [Ornithinimicrobium sp. HY1793]
MRRMLRGIHGMSMAMLTVVWVLLMGEVTLGNVVAGVLVAFLVQLVFPLPSVTVGVHFRPIAFVVLAVRFLWDMSYASVHVAWLAVRPGPTVSGIVVDLRLRSDNELFQTITAEMVALVPGTVVIDLDGERQILTLHLLDVTTRQQAEVIRHRVMAQEARVLRAFDPDPEAVLNPRRAREVTS